MSIRSRSRGGNDGRSEVLDFGGPVFSTAVFKKSSSIGRSLVFMVAAAILLGLTPLINLFGQSVPGTDQPSNSIRGIVINAVTSEPISRALVSSPDSRFAIMTDAQGYFEFKFAPSPMQGAQSNLPQPNRPSAVTVRKPGYIENFDATVNIEASSDRSDLKIALTPEALITGRVMSSGSELDDRIQVELYQRKVQNGLGRWLVVASTATRSNGEFRFAELTAGEYKLLSRESLDRDPLTFDPKAQQYGYPPAFFPNAGDFASAKLITISAGTSVAADITVSRQPYYPVKIKVLNAPAGTGLAIDVWAVGRPGPGFSLGFNVQTQTIEGLLPNGNYAIEASSYSQIGVNGSTIIGVKGSAVTGSSLALVPNSSVGVEVKEEFSADNDATGQSPFVSHRNNRVQSGPRSYLNVILESADDFVHARGGALRQPAGSEDESLSIDNVQPGRYWVTVQSSRGFASSITSAAIDLKHSPLIVGAGGETSPIQITMRNGGVDIGGSVEGVVDLARTQSPVHVYLLPLPDSSGGDVREIFVGPDGKFEAVGIAPGSYQVLAVTPSTELEYRNPEAMRAYDLKGIVVHLVDGQKETLKLHLISPVGE